MPKTNNMPAPGENSSPLKLDNGSRIAVIGGGPAGSFFSYSALDLAERLGIDIQIDVYEQKDFSRCGPAGCNHCGGIVSESLVQILSAEGINIPSHVVQCGIDSYVLHMDVGSVRIDTPLQEKRIAAMYRGGGPFGTKGITWGGFDGYLQKLTQNKGADLIRERVVQISLDNGYPIVKTKGGLSRKYELIAGAVGINASSLKLFDGLVPRFRPPDTAKTFICEFQMGRDLVKKHFGDSMHVFLLNVPRLEFAALVPKNEYVSLVLLGRGIDKELVRFFLNTPEVKGCFPPGWMESNTSTCKCFPRINTSGALQPFSDRIVLIGDCSVTKLYKNGIGSAFSVAKAAAATALLHGVSCDDFAKHFMPVLKDIIFDNNMGKILFTFTRRIQKRDFAKYGILRMVSKEQQKSGNRRHMSTVLWDTFTGSAPYKEIVMRTLHPIFIFNLIRETASAILFKKGGASRRFGSGFTKSESLGRIYRDGEIIINQGEVGDCLYVIQDGKAEVLQTENGKEIRLAVLDEGEFFGEMALFDREVRSGTVRALDGEVRVLTVDKMTLLRRLQEDPSLAFRLLEKMSSRIRGMNEQLRHAKSSGLNKETI